MFGIICNVICILAILYSITDLIKNWKLFPNSVPLHFDFSGKPDNYESRYALLIFPIISIFIFILFTFITKAITTDIQINPIDKIGKLSVLYGIEITKVTITLTLSMLLNYITDLILNNKERLSKTPMIIAIISTSIIILSIVITPIIINLFVK